MNQQDLNKPSLGINMSEAPIDIGVANNELKTSHNEPSKVVSKHRWSRPMKSFCDTGSYCLDCGLKREKHGLLGTWYSNNNTDMHGWAKQPCIPGDKISTKHT